MRNDVTLTSNDVMHYVVKKSTQKMDTSSQKSSGAGSENEEAFMSADEGKKSIYRFHYELFESAKPTLNI